MLGDDLYRLALGYGGVFEIRNRRWTNETSFHIPRLTVADQGFCGVTMELRRMSGLGDLLHDDDDNDDDDHYPAAGERRLAAERFDNVRVELLLQTVDLGLFQAHVRKGHDDFHFL